MKITRAFQDTWNYNRLLSNGNIWLSYATQAAVAAQNSVHQLAGPTGVTTAIALYDILCWKTAAGLVQMEFDNVTRTTAVTPYNFAGNAPLGRVFKDTIASLPTKRAEFQVGATPAWLFGGSNPRTTPFRIFVVNQSIELLDQTVNEAFTAGFLFGELPL